MAESRFRHRIAEKARMVGRLLVGTLKTSVRCFVGDNAGQGDFDGLFDRQGQGFFDQGRGMTDKSGKGGGGFKAEIAQDGAEPALIRPQGNVQRPFAVAATGMKRAPQQRRQRRGIEVADQSQPVGMAAAGQLGGGDDLAFCFIDETLDPFRLPPRAQIERRGGFVVVEKAAFGLLHQGRGIATVQPLQGNAIRLSLAAHMRPDGFILGLILQFDPRMAKEGFLDVGHKADGRDRRLGLVFAFQAEVEALDAVFAGLQADMLQQGLPDRAGLRMGMVGRRNARQIGLRPGKTLDGLDKAVNRVGAVGDVEIRGRARAMPGQRRSHRRPYHGQRIGKAVFQAQRGAAPGQALQTQAVTQAKGLDQGPKGSKNGNRCRKMGYFYCSTIRPFDKREGLLFWTMDDAGTFAGGAQGEL